MLRLVAFSIIGIGGLTVLLGGFSDMNKRVTTAREAAVPEDKERLAQKDLATTTPQGSTGIERASATTSPQEGLFKTIEKKEEPAIPPPTIVKKNTSRSIQLPKAETPPLANETAPASIEPSTPTYSLDEVNTETRKALVNILCTSQSGGSFNPASGSGIIIDKRGVILTNAHVAQYFLLKDYNGLGTLNCVIRTGSPAIPTYRAELLFLSPAWVDSNYTKINEQNPTGTGRHDYAFLLITESVRPDTPLPAEFPFIPASVENKSPVADNLLVAGYPAGFLGGIATQMNLSIASTIQTVGNVYNFSPGMFDLFNMNGSILAQKGSSGGAVVNAEKNLVGIIVTTTDAKTTGGRNLQAITTSYINRELKVESGLSLEEMLSGDLTSLSKQFRDELAKALADKLVGELNKR